MRMYVYLPGKIVCTIKGVGVSTIWVTQRLWYLSGAFLLLQLTYNQVQFLALLLMFSYVVPSENWKKFTTTMKIEPDCRLFFSTRKLCSGMHQFDYTHNLASLLQLMANCLFSGSRRKMFCFVFLKTKAGIGLLLQRNWLNSHITSH